jgi:ubiquinone/menaquinone biosynthesis C-methylase UbiE
VLSTLVAALVATGSAARWRSRSRLGGVADLRVDYDRIASNYDRRYQTDRYPDAERMLKEWIGSSPGRLLEVGCGTGYWLSALAGPGRTLLGLDRSGAMLAIARRTAPDARLVRGEAMGLPFADRSVEALLCMNALHHFPDKPGFLAEAARVLAPGGAFCTIGLDPHRGEPRWAVYDYFEGTRAADLERYPSCVEIRRWLEDSGFTSCSTRPAQHIRSSTPAVAALRSPMMRKDGTSQLALLSDAAYERGIAAIRADAEHARAAGRQRVLETDLELIATLATRC